MSIFNINNTYISNNFIRYPYSGAISWRDKTAPQSDIKNKSYYGERVDLILPGGTRYEYFGNQLDGTRIMANGRLYARDYATGGPYVGPCKGVCENLVFIGGPNFVSDDTGCNGTSGKAHGTIENGIIYFENKSLYDIVLTIKSFCTLPEFDSISCHESTHLVPSCGSSNSQVPNSCEVCYVWEPAKYGVIDKNYNTECLLNGPCQNVTANFTNVFALDNEGWNLVIYNLLLQKYNLKYSFDENGNLLVGHYIQEIDLPDFNDTWYFYIDILKNSNGSTMNLSINSTNSYNGSQTLFAANYTTNEVTSDNPKQSFGGVVQSSTGAANWLNNGNFSMFVNFNDE